MKDFTPWEYLLIDCANQWGLDKETFQTRINWATENLESLEQLAAERDHWKEKPLFIKAIRAVRDAQAGIATGHTIGFDAVCSGMQIMSALTGCHASAKATGLINTGERPDAYTKCTGIMSDLLKRDMSQDRKAIKQAVMTVLYGSKAEPRKLFGEDTPELEAFYKAMQIMAPGPCKLLIDLLNSWQPDTLVHEWILPDGYTARVKVMQKHEHRLEIDELNHATFTYEWYENAPVPKDRKNAANVVHSVDSYVLRSLVRRCNYDRASLEELTHAMEIERLARAADQSTPVDADFYPEAVYYIEHYQRSQCIDITIFDVLTYDSLTLLTDQHLYRLHEVAKSMLEHQPFEVITVHDCFQCHPNHMTALRKHYRNILADIADSRLIEDILSQLHGAQGVFTKESHDLSRHIRQSEYALC